MPTTKSRAEYYRLRRLKAKLNETPAETKRVCAEEGCNTVLNKYNLNECCWAHNTAYVIRNGIKVDIGY